MAAPSFHRLARAVLAVVGLAVAGPAAPGAAAGPATGSVSGVAWEFAPDGGPISGGEVTLLEHPGRSATTAADGSWRIDGVPLGGEVTPVLTWAGGPPVQTATWPFAADLDRVVFQAPSTGLTAALAAVLGVAIDPQRCQIASTVTRRGHDLSHPAPDGTHGEPGATAALAPTAGDGPVYFNLVTATVIWPDRSLAATTADGGVLFANVPPGDYVLSAGKPGADIAPVHVGCRAGVITNAAPPRGLQVLTGGLDPGTVGPTSTTSAPTSSVPSTAVTTTAPPAGAGPGSVATVGPSAVPAVAAFAG